LWEGSYEDTTTTWLRWVDEEGHLVLTGKELAEREAARASREAARAERLADKLRELGVDPDAIG
jgi:uncharacterized protein YciI